MKLSELMEKYGDYEVSEELLEMIKPKGEWTPNIGEEYWFISCGEVIGITWENHPCDLFCLGKRNVYQTKEEAQFALDMYNFCKERSFEPYWDDCSQTKFTLYLDYELRKADWEPYDYRRYFEPFYYPTEEAVKEVIDKYSFEEIEKYYGKV